LQSGLKYALIPETLKLQFDSIALFKLFRIFASANKLNTPTRLPRFSKKKRKTEYVYTSYHVELDNFHTRVYSSRLVSTSLLG
jgi:hypothetical protein